MNSMAIVDFEPKLCSGCWACTMTCVDQNDLVLEEACDAFRLVSRKEYDEKGNLILSWKMEGCMHCDSCACETVCPCGCFETRENGLVILSNAECIGCEACAQVCPHNAIHFVKGKAVKCNGCEERVKAGLRPACERICPSGALTFVLKT